MLAAVYARKSTEQAGVADEAKSVTRQIDHARQFAARKGWTVSDEYVYVDLLDLAHDWRRVLTEDPRHARPIVTMLLDGRVTFTPTGTPKQWEMQGTGTLCGLFSREIFPLGMASLSIPSWNQLHAWLQAMRQLRNSMGFAA